MNSDNPSLNPDKLAGVVLVDVNHAFKRTLVDGTKRQVYTLESRLALSRNIAMIGAKEVTFNTNGGHYALTAMGNPTVFGNITTAVGGAFDIAGMLHVIEAGGCVASIELDDGDARVLENPQDLYRADVVVAANSEQNLLRLVLAAKRPLELR